MLNSVSAVTACALAGFVNAYIMRQTEIKTGIDVCDKKTNQSYGKSKICASKAILQTSTSRILFSLPMFLPPLILMILEKVRMMPRNKAGKLTIEITLMILYLYLAAPLGLALFPQQGLINADELEPQFQQIRDAEGHLINEFVYNKGL